MFLPHLDTETDLCNINNKKAIYDRGLLCANAQSLIPSLITPPKLMHALVQSAPRTTLNVLHFLPIYFIIVRACQWKLCNFLIFRRLNK